MVNMMRRFKYKHFHDDESKKMRSRPEPTSIVIVETYTKYHDELFSLDEYEMKHLEQMFYANTTSDDVKRNETMLLFNVTNMTDATGEVWTSYYIVLVVLVCVLIIVTILGNTLVIMAVLTTKKLRTVTNCFVTSLAIADWLVGVFVMPPALLLHHTGAWTLGSFMCDVWISMDVLLCSASILSLCAISVDRYLAVTRPLRYSRRKRSKRLAFFMIFAVWIIALAITCPTMLGWFMIDKENCRYSQNPSYVIFSAMGSFFIPMVIMLYVYIRISCVVARRQQRLSAIASNKSQKFFRWACLTTKHDVSESINEQNSETNQYQAAQNNENPSHSTQSYMADPDKDNRESLELREIDQINCEDYHNIVKTHSFRRSFKRGSLNSKVKTASFRSSLTMNLKRNRMSMRSNKKLQNSEYQNNIASSKTTKTLTIVMGGFIACWLPFFLLYSLTPYVEKNYYFQISMVSLTWLGWFNSTINPFIYAFYSPEFRLAFWRLTFKQCFKNHKTVIVPHAK